MSVFRVTHSLRARSGLVGVSRPGLITSLPKKQIITQPPPIQTLAPRKLLLHTGPDKKPKNVIFGVARNGEEFYGPMRSIIVPLITVWTASVSKDSSKVAQAIREHIKNRVGEAEGGLAFLEVLHDAPDIQAEDLALTYGVNAVPSLVVFDPKWQMPVDEGARVTDLAKLRDDLLITEFLKETARRGKEERSNGKYK